MLPLHGVPVARGGRLSWLQFIERRPVMDDPGSLLPGHHSHEATLDFELADLPNQRKKVVSHRKRTAVVGRYESQAHVTVTEVRWQCNPTGKHVTSGIIDRIHRCEGPRTLAVPNAIGAYSARFFCPNAKDRQRAGPEDVCQRHIGSVTAIRN